MGSEMCIRARHRAANAVSARPAKRARALCAPRARRRCAGTPWYRARQTVHTSGRSTCARHRSRHDACTCACVPRQAHGCRSGSRAGASQQIRQVGSSAMSSPAGIAAIFPWKGPPKIWRCLNGQADAQLGARLGARGARRGEPAARGIEPRRDCAGQHIYRAPLHIPRRHLARRARVAARCARRRALGPTPCIRARAVGSRARSVRACCRLRRRASCARR